MTTKRADPDPLPEYDFSSGVRGRYAESLRNGYEVAIDGAVSYSLRLIPSNKVLGRFTSTREAWPVILAEIEGGRAPRTLVLDWHDATGRTGRLSSGRLIEDLARSGMGLPRPASGAGGRQRRIAER